MRARPLVATLLRVPLLVEGLRDALASIADVHAFEAHDGDVGGLLASVQPDAVIVDGAETAEAVLAFATAHGAPAIFVRLRDQELDVAEDGRWRRHGALSPDAIRSVLAGTLAGRAHA